MNKTMSFLIGVVLRAALAFGMGQASQNVNVVSPCYRQMTDTVSAGNFYSGKAIPTAGLHQPLWRIKYTETIGNIVKVQYMNYSVEFNQIWDNRKLGDY